MRTDIRLQTWKIYERERIISQRRRSTWPVKSVTFSNFSTLIYMHHRSLRHIKTSEPEYQQENQLSEESKPTHTSNLINLIWCLHHSPSNPGRLPLFIIHLCDCTDGFALAIRRRWQHAGNRGGASDERWRGNQLALTTYIAFSRHEWDLYWMLSAPRRSAWPGATLPSSGALAGVSISEKGKGVCVCMHVYTHKYK